jgi:hypothetical protein
VTTFGAAISRRPLLTRPPPRSDAGQDTSARHTRTCPPPSPRDHRLALKNLHGTCDTSDAPPESNRPRRTAPATARHPSRPASKALSQNDTDVHSCPRNQQQFATPPPGPVPDAGVRPVRTGPLSGPSVPRTPAASGQGLRCDLRPPARSSVFTH